MILKESIELAYRDQQSRLKYDNQYLIDRQYLDRYTPTGGHIEVISGIRRSGKSTLMNQIRHLYYPGAAYFNFEDSRTFGFEVNDFSKLDEIIPHDTPAYFFDEIQNVDSWEIFVRQLHDRKKKVYVTGSNATLLSRELGTRLTGRHIRHELFPFSYKEFLSFKNLVPSPETFDQYVENGGFPEYLSDGDPMILQNLFKDIVLRDIAVRHGIRNTHILMEIALYLLTNTGKETSYNSLRKAFGIGAANTVSDYLSWLEDAWVIFQLHRFSWSTKNRSVNPRKIYVIDTGMVRANTLSFSADRGRLLENSIYLHLRQSGNEIFYFREEKECDFVVFENRTCKMVIQVCEQVTNDNLKRETSGLIEAMDSFKLPEGIIITRDQKDTLNVDGHIIQLIPAYQFVSL
jgi:predicted AAA+ superfamily ATPase